MSYFLLLLVITLYTGSYSIHSMNLAETCVCNSLSIKGPNAMINNKKCGAVYGAIFLGVDTTYK